VGAGLSPLHPARGDVQQCALAAGGEPVHHRAEHGGGGVGPFPAAHPAHGQLTQLRVQVDRRDERGQLGRQRCPRRQLVDHRKGQAGRVDRERGQQPGRLRAIRRVMQVVLGDLLLVGGRLGLGPRHDLDQRPAPRRWITDRDDHPGARGVHPGPDHPGVPLDGPLDPPGHPFAARPVHPVRLDVEPPGT
jgi:hypothetical protein